MPRLRPSSRTHTRPAPDAVGGPARVLEAWWLLADNVTLLNLPCTHSQQSAHTSPKACRRRAPHPRLALPHCHPSPRSGADEPAHSSGCPHVASGGSSSAAVRAQRTSPRLRAETGPRAAISVRPRAKARAHPATQARAATAAKGAPQLALAGVSIGLRVCSRGSGAGVAAGWPARALGPSRVSRPSRKAPSF